ncbi:MAG: hypothetical protein OS112_06305 [Methanoregula sp.]|nr:MAG: hypothetical protein OS112_06305 [Methanoregula sp.]
MRWVLVRAVVLGLFIVVAVIGMVWLVSIPLLAVWQSSITTGLPPPSSPSPTQTMTSPAATETVLPSGSTEQPPKNSEVYFSVQPKDGAGRVVVRFEGGPGKSMVKEIEVRLTKADGNVVTAKMDTRMEFPEVNLMGTKSTDRVEVFVRFLSGKTYKVIDEPVIYRQRY